MGPAKSLKKDASLSFPLLCKGWGRYGLIDPAGVPESGS